ncbi:MAG TPA: hypothetical protein VMU59_09885, partial [Caulobacteraceae bacterium]|nr:hypothetical protein [Caulobacteraceae bacterium]
MHFRRPDQLSWQAYAETSDVVIVLTTVPVREIDKHANLHSVQRLRDRARGLKGWIRGLIGKDATPAKASVDVREPLAFLTGGLDPNIQDDRLIASALMLREEGKDVAVFSDDTLLHAKLSSFGIRGIWPNDDDRLKDEPDPLEAENSRLKRELATFTNRRPELFVE